MSFYGHGFKMHAGDTDLAGHDDEADVLFASGAAMVVDAEVFARVGGFDERYFMFFEDVDLGWRLWLLGYEVRYVPASVVYHRHHASMAEVGSWREHFLLERNALFTIYKNYDDENLRAVLPAALALTVGRSVVPVVTTRTCWRCRCDSDESENVSVHKETLAGPFAVDAFLTALDELTKSRQELQARGAAATPRSCPCSGSRSSPTRTCEDSGSVRAILRRCSIFPRVSKACR